MDDEALQKLGHRVREARERHGLSQTELAAQIGSSQAAISRLESGTQEPGLSKLSRLCSVLELSLDDLVDREEVTDA